MKRLGSPDVLLMALGIMGAASDPYSGLTPQQRSLLKPVVERYVRDLIKQDWADLRDIQDQTSDLKNKLLSGP